MKTQKITSSILRAELETYKTTDIYKSLPKNKQIEAVMDLELMIKFEINREIFESEFGYYPEGDIITDEELEEFRVLEKTINSEVAQSFKLFEIKNSGKKSFNKKNNMDFMFR